MTKEYAEEIAKAQIKQHEFIQYQLAINAFADYVAQKWRNDPDVKKEETPSE